MSPILEVKDIFKRYPGVQAVDGLSLAIEPGSCFGLLGPNGAGKTTTIEIIEGITTASSGEILYKGESQGRRFKLESGIQFQSTALQDNQTVLETLQMFADLYPGGMAIDELVELCSLDAFIDQDARKVSGGQRQRLLLAIALVNDPDIVFLDEPTTGLDPQARRNFWSLVERIKARDKTILLTTHYMEEAYILCDRIAIMDHGRIIAEGTPRELLKKHFNDSVLQLPARHAAALESLPYPLYRHGESVELLVKDVNATIKQLLECEIPLDELIIRERTLEDLFLELTGKELRA
ncbi:MAG: ABC transporter ATP-binding protein [Gammaproteobacteria bacterium]|nr:ABC transporter ATP-binding protein [Gammaproteobacteria bacterium]